jgi:hypothetical protein
VQHKNGRARTRFVLENSRAHHESADFGEYFRNLIMVVMLFTNVRVNNRRMVFADNGHVAHSPRPVDVTGRRRTAKCGAGDTQSRVD